MLALGSGSVAVSTGEGRTRAAYAAQTVVTMDAATATKSKVLGDINIIGCPCTRPLGSFPSCGTISQWHCRHDGSGRNDQSSRSNVGAAVLLIAVVAVGVASTQERTRKAVQRVLSACDCFRAFATLCPATGLAI